MANTTFYGGEARITIRARAYCCEEFIYRGSALHADIKGALLEAYGKMWSFIPLLKQAYTEVLDTELERGEHLQLRNLDGTVYDAVQQQNVNSWLYGIIRRMHAWPKRCYVLFAYLRHFLQLENIVVQQHEAELFRSLPLEIEEGFVVEIWKNENEHFRNAYQAYKEEREDEKHEVDCKEEREDEKYEVGLLWKLVVRFHKDAHEANVLRNSGVVFASTMEQDAFLLKHPENSAAYLSAPIATDGRNSRGRVFHRSDVLGPVVAPNRNKSRLFVTETRNMTSITSPQYFQLTFERAYVDQKSSLAHSVSEEASNYEVTILEKYFCIIVMIEQHIKSESEITVSFSEISKDNFSQPNEPYLVYRSRPAVSAT